MGENNKIKNVDEMVEALQDDALSAVTAGSMYVHLDNGKKVLLTDQQERLYKRCTTDRERFEHLRHLALNHHLQYVD